MAPTDAAKSDDSQEIDEIIEELGDWRGPKLSRLRSIIKEAVPGVDEELKWRKPSGGPGGPTWRGHSSRVHSVST